MSRVTQPVLAAAVLLLAACADSPAAPGAFAAASRSPDRNHAGSCSSTFAVLPPTVGQAPNVIKITIAYNCLLTHLGNTTGEVLQTVTFGQDGIGQITNTTTYTAANGDQLYATFAGTGTPTSSGGFILNGTETYVGGTGRFASASGSTSLVGAAQFTSPTGGVGQFDVRGTLSY